MVKVCFAILLLAAAQCRASSYPGGTPSATSLRQHENDNDLPENPLKEDDDVMGTTNPLAESEQTLSTEGAVGEPQADNATTDGSTALAPVAAAAPQKKTNFNDLKVRTLSAVLLLTALTGLIKFSPGDSGLKLLTIVCQYGLFSEVTNVLGVGRSFWIYLTYFQAWVVPHFWKEGNHIGRVIAFGMIVDSVCKMILTTKTNFQPALSKLGSQHIAAVSTLLYFQRLFAPYDAPCSQSSLLFYPVGNHCNIILLVCHDQYVWKFLGLLSGFTGCYQ